MFRDGYSIIYLFFLIFGISSSSASTQLHEDTVVRTDSQMFLPNQELIIGMPMMGDPPYSFKDSVQGFSGPIPDVASQLARKLGLTLRYKEYLSYGKALDGLSKGEIHLLIDFSPGKQWQKNIVSMPFLTTVPRGVVLNHEHPALSIDDALNMKWVCVTGGDACDELSRHGVIQMAMVENQNEAIFMLQQGVADGFLEDLPSLLATLAHYPNTGFKIITPEWLSMASFSLNMSKIQPELVRMLSTAFDGISLNQQQYVLEAINKPDSFHLRDHKKIHFTEDELLWLQQHPVLTYGISPKWAPMSEYDYRGHLVGFIPEVLDLMRQYSGLKFSLVKTDSWGETMTLFQNQKLDFLPAISPSQERSKIALFTPDYVLLDRVIIGPKHSKELSGLEALQGHRVGMVHGSVDKDLLEGLGAHPVEVSHDTLLLKLIDTKKVDYVIYTLPTLIPSLSKGFAEQYQVVYSGNDLRLPLAIAVQTDEPMLQRILTKVIYGIPPTEIRKLEQRWLSMSVQKGLNTERVLLWVTIGGTAALLIFILFWFWNRMLQKQILQRRIAEQKLNEQLVFVKTLLNSLPSMVVLRDRQQTLTLCNSAYRDSFIGTQPSDGLNNIQPEEREQIIREECSIWATGEMLEGEKQSRRRDGTLFHVIYVKLPYRSPDGAIQGVLTVLTDVTAIKTAEHKVREAEVRLKNITDSMPGVVYQYSWQGLGQGRFLYVSQGAKCVFGMTPNELKTVESGGEIFGLTEDAHLAFVHEVAKHAETLTPLDLEVKVPDAEGWRYLQVRGNFVPHSNGELILNGVVQDITALKQQEYELREARAYAEEAMQARSRFLATMSHELRTPISGMHGMLELLRMSELTEDQRYLLRNVETSTNNLLYLVNDILDFSKIEAGQLKLNYQQSRLQSVICDVIRGHAMHAYGKGLNVNLSWATSVPDQAIIDAIRVGQVISNLLNNAVKFTEKGSVSINVSYCDERLGITVSDTGIGIAIEKQALLFTPFEQADSDINRRFGGTGLGLAICEQLVKKMGGSLTLSSQAGEGASFSFTIPLSDCHWDLPALANSKWQSLGVTPQIESIMTHLGAAITPFDINQLQGSEGGLLLADEHDLEQTFGTSWQARLQDSGFKGIVFSTSEALRGQLIPNRWWRLGQSPIYPDLLLDSCLDLLVANSKTSRSDNWGKLGGRVLVADDHPVNRALLVRQLAILGVDCEVVEDGEQALQIWQSQHFSMLLTDCHMPVMDGYTLAHTLRKIGEHAPIIGVTADISEDATTLMATVGMSDMLLKPYSLESLYQILLKWLPAGIIDTGSQYPTNQESIDEQAIRWCTLFGNSVVAKNMAIEYLSSNSKDCENMITALNARDYQGMAEIAHRIKGAARMVGELQLAEQAAKLESAARLKELDGLNELVDDIHTLINQIKFEMGAWIDE